MGYQPEIDEQVCAMHGVCEAIAPEAFQVEDVAAVIGTAPDEKLLEAARNCPTEAIRLREEKTGHHAFPD